MSEEMFLDEDNDILTYEDGYKQIARVLEQLKKAASWNDVVSCAANLDVLTADVHISAPYVSDSSDRYRSCSALCAQVNQMLLRVFQPGVRFGDVQKLHDEAYDRVSQIITNIFHRQLSFLRMAHGSELISSRLKLGSR